MQAKTNRLSLESRIETLIDTFINKNMPFTLHDVFDRIATLASEYWDVVRMFSRYADKIIASKMYPYMRSIRPVLVPGQGTFSQVIYHNSRMNPADYRFVPTPMNLTDIPKAPTMPKASKTTVTADKPKAKKSKVEFVRDASGAVIKKETIVRETYVASASHPVVTARDSASSTKRSDGYVEVPRKIWEKAGFKPGKQFIAVIHPNSIGLFHLSKRSKYNNQFDDLKAKPNSVVSTVPAAGRFRIPGEILLAAGLSGVTVAFHHFTDKIVVSKELVIA